MTKQQARKTLRAEDFSCLLLETGGWRKAPDGWRHPRLFYPWPKTYALRLQQEVDDGGQGLVFRMMRGEV